MTPEHYQRLTEIVAQALELPQQERAEFVARSCADDSALRREVESVLQQDGARVDRLTEGLNSSASGEGIVGTRLGAYAVIGVLGRGGMGEVYLGQRADQEFEKKVAIKVLKRGTDTEEVLRRFRSERQILAQLEHPNIARLLDAGTTPDGLPYFVMEYVAGLPINNYCQEQNLSIRARVTLFLKVCEAVDFAHRNLVVHRDLKPANVLVTADGEPKLLDFGIAKLLAETDGTLQFTVPSERRLTPDYASPEQVRGAQVTTVSDVYSLGALLYAILAGSSPHRFPTATPPSGELERVIVREGAPRASHVALAPELQRALRGDLDNVLETALRKEPERRYSGVSAFADDLTRFLEGKPVRARPATFTYRASRFIGRNKFPVAAAALVFVMLVGGLIALGREKARAEDRFQQVRRLARAVVFDYHDAIAVLPGSTEVRARLVRDALEYLDRLARDSGGDPQLEIELAEAYLKIGDVQGKPYTANLGDSASALRSYTHALEIAQRLASDTDETTAARLAAQAHASRAAVHARRHELDAATEDNERALAIGEAALQKDAPNPDDWRHLVASCYLGLGDAIQAGNHDRRDPSLYRAALADYERARPLAEQLVAAQPTSISALRLAGKTYARIAGILVGARGEAALPEAARFHGRNIELIEAALQLPPKDSSLRRSLAVGLVAKAYTNIAVGRDLETAAVDCARALPILEEVRAADPSNREAQQDLSYGFFVSGRVQQLLNDRTQAAVYYRQALAILSPLVAANPENNETRFDLEETRRGLTEVSP